VQIRTLWSSVPLAWLTMLLWTYPSVASTVDNANLHGPLGLALASNGNLIMANGDAVNPGGTQNTLVEFTATGKFVGQFQVDPGPGGGAFGLAFSTGGDLRFAAVDDDQNTLDIWDLD
jgi:hypothetical protein